MHACSLKRCTAAGTLAPRQLLLAPAPRSAGGPSRAAPGAAAAASTTCSASSSPSSSPVTIPDAAKHAIRLKRVGPEPTPLSAFMRKCRKAWEVFFPPAPAPVTAKEQSRRRLQMILVSDRCGLTPQALAEMKQNALLAFDEYVDVEGGLEITFETVLANGKVKRISIPVSSIYDDADNGTAAAADDLAALDSMMAAAEAEEEQSDGSAAEAAARRRQ